MLQQRRHVGVWSKQINSALKHFTRKALLMSQTQIAILPQRTAAPMLSETTYCYANWHVDVLWKQRGELSSGLFSLLACVYSQTSGRVRTAYTRENPHVCINLKTQHYKILHNCNMAQFWAGSDGNRALREVEYREKRPGKGSADYFKDPMWADGSKHADRTWCEICSRILAAPHSRWRWDSHF